MFIYLLTNICNDMPLDIIGEAEHSYMAVGGMMCHPILAQISPHAFSYITVAMCYWMSWQVAIQLATRGASGSGHYRN